MVKGRGFNVTDEAGSGAFAAGDADDAVDAMVAAIGPRLGAPTTQSRDVVLVTGPWLAGVSGVVAALCERLPEHTFIEPAELAAGEAATGGGFGALGAVCWPPTATRCRRTRRATVTCPGSAWLPCPSAVNHASTTSSSRYAINSPTPIFRDETGCARGNPGCRPSLTATIVTPTARVGGRGSRHYVSSAAVFCGSDGCRSPSARSRRAARPSRLASSCLTTPATAAPRCAQSCRRIWEVSPDANCRSSRRTPAGVSTRW